MIVVHLNYSKILALSSGYSCVINCHSSVISFVIPAKAGIQMWKTIAGCRVAARHDGIELERSVNNFLEGNNCMQTVKKVLGLGVISLAVAIGTSSCAAASAQIHHSDLTVESKMSNSIFLNPLDTADKKIYVQVKNTSTETLHDLSRQIKLDLAANGYTVVRDPKLADDLLQVNVLQFGAAKTPEEVWKSMHSGYGSVVTGALAGIGVGVFSGSAAWGVGAALGVAAASWIANEMIQDKAYSMITDVQISVKQADKTWHKHDTRVATVADKVNLKFEEAKPVIVKQIAQEITSIFGPNDIN